MVSTPFEFNPYSPEIDRDPFPAYAQLRDRYPCFWSEHAKMWVLSRYEDISNALQDWETYSSSGGNLMDELPNRAGSTLGSTDPPRHDHLRSLVQVAFTRKVVDGVIPIAQEVAERCLTAIKAKGRFDFVEDFSSQITVTTLFEMMGLPPGDHREVRNNVMLSMQSDSVTRKKEARHIDAFKKLVDYITAQVEDRRKTPKDDLISKMISAEIDGAKLSESEIVMTSTTLVFAGVESLSSFLTMFALNLHDFPEERGKLVAHPELIPSAIEESLRFNTSAQRFRRILMRDVELHGQSMKKGTFVCLCYGSGNRDERKFEQPDAYRVERNPKGHLGFGGGKHLCLGTSMARQVTAAVMTQYLAAIPDFKITDTNLNWTPSTTFRSPLALPLEIE
ncbi:MAG: cytochrome P450 [Deltaproteobacteria bacterium]|nr:cytochrome P450 [Deltaproteobacteria bacterium]